MPEEGLPMTNPPPPDRDPLERALARLRPAAGSLDVSALMYRAGEQSRAAAAGRWRRAFVVAAVGCVAAGYAGYVAIDRPPRAGVTPPAAPADRFDGPATDPNLEALGRAIVGGVRSRNAAIDAAPGVDPTAEYQRARREQIGVKAALPRELP